MVNEPGYVRGGEQARKGKIVEEIKVPANCGGQGQSARQNMPFPDRAEESGLQLSIGFKGTGISHW